MIDSVARACRLFFDKVLFLEEVAADPLGQLSGVFDFLGMDLVDEAEGKKVGHCAGIDPPSISFRLSHR